jgi:hypothetical protein
MRFENQQEAPLLVFMRAQHTMTINTSRSFALWPAAAISKSHNTFLSAIGRRARAHNFSLIYVFIAAAFYSLYLLRRERVARAFVN